jgi:Zn-dependent protease
MSGGAASVSSGFAIVALLVYMLYLGVIINFSYAVFNLIPVPPLDGSRIFYVVLPPKWYFAVMKYERYIMFGMLALLWIGILDLPLSLAVGGLEKLTFSLFGMDELSTAALQLIQIFVGTSL